MKVSKNHLISFFSFAFLVSALPVLAQENQPLTPEQQAQSDSLIQEAVEHYSAHRYNEAIECFKQAYEIIEEQELLFNIARAHQKMSNKKEAIEWYERFLGAPGTTSDLRKLALTNSEKLRREIAAEEAKRVKKCRPRIPRLLPKQKPSSTPNRHRPTEQFRAPSLLPCSVPLGRKKKAPRSRGLTAR